MSFYTIERALEVLANLGARVKIITAPRPGGGMDVGANVYFPSSGEERDFAGQVIEIVTQELIDYAQIKAFGKMK